jgi:cell volume regulation protein A
MVVDFGGDLVVGAVVGILVGLGARAAFVRLDYPTPGLYPVASIAAAALSFGLAGSSDASGFLAVYLTGLILGTGIVPARQTVTAFHQGLSWVAQISLFFLLGLLVFPSQLGSVALEATALALAVIFVARPLATFIAAQVGSFDARERVMLSWAGLRGAVPIWLATLPVIAGVDESGQIFNVVFYVVVISTLLQGFTFEPLARRLGLTTSETALPHPVVETGTIQELGGDVFAVRIDDGDAASGRMVKELGLPREALISVIVRSGEAVLPRGSTVIAGGDELHVLVRRERHGEISRLIESWREGPLPTPPQVPIGVRGSPAIFSVRPTRPDDGDTGAPETVDGIEVALTLRTRPDVPAAVVVLADGRFAVTGPDLIAVGGRRTLSRWCTRRARSETVSPQDRAWLQEAIGTIDAPDLR